MAAARALPYVRHASSGVNGYGLVRLEPRQATVSFRTVGTVKEKTSPISTHARFTVEAGRPGVVPA